MSVSDHEDLFPDWPFKDGPHTGVYLSQTVHERTEAVVHVSHDHDGDWQFLGESMSGGGGPVLVCLHHPIQADPSLRQLFDLPVGWYAERDAPDEPWVRAQLEAEESDD